MNHRWERRMELYPVHQRERERDWDYGDCWAEFERGSVRLAEGGQSANPKLVCMWLEGSVTLLGVKALCPGTKQYQRHQKDWWLGGDPKPGVDVAESFEWFEKNRDPWLLEEVGNTMDWGLRECRGTSDCRCIIGRRRAVLCKWVNLYQSYRFSVSCVICI